MAYSQLNNVNNSGIPTSDFLPQQTAHQINNGGHSSQDLQINDQNASLNSSTSPYLTNSQSSSSFQRLDLPSPVYPAGNSDVPSKERIQEIFITLKNKFGFQEDNRRNMFNYLIGLIETR
jgi:1,3-beta-glucan synthase